MRFILVMAVVLGAAYLAFPYMKLVFLKARNIYRVEKEKVDAEYEKELKQENDSEGQ